MHDNLKNIRNLSPNILTNLNQLIVNRIGKTPNACMLTRDIVSFVSPDQTYRFGRDRSLYASKPSIQRLANPSSKVPEHTVLTGTWDNHKTTVNSTANILGGMGMLILDNHQCMQIPVITATSENLGFYHARLLSVGDILTFETQQNLPLTEVSIGADYVEHYLALAEYGGGEYIEYHAEPHLWAPKHAQCRGHILLGKQVNTQFYFTGFRIPFGQAVYLKPNTLHSDAYLIGEYSVVYTTTKDYSTVTFRDKTKQIKRLEFLY